MFPGLLNPVQISSICSWRYITLFLCLSILISQTRVISSADVAHLDDASGAGEVSLYKIRRLMQGRDESNSAINAEMQKMINDLNRERLVGSSPPKCIKKCGKCTPCSSVLVPIHSTFPASPTQYYPEAWRCQCKGKIYNP